MAMHVDQRGATAGGDNVAGDKTVNQTINQYLSTARSPAIVEQLLERLPLERDQQESRSSTHRGEPHVLHTSADPRMELSSLRRS